MRLVPFIAIASLGASPLIAQPRTLDVPAEKSWQHAATGVVLRPEAAGLTRAAILDNGSSEMDVLVQYRGPGVIATVYIFRTRVPVVAIWTDRAVSALATNPELGAAPTAIPSPQPFKRPGAGTASGLRATIPLSVPLSASAVAVAPLREDWLVKVRMTAKSLSPTELDARVTEMIEAIRWPAERETFSAAAPMADCPTPLRLKRAKILASDIGSALLDSLTGIVPEEEAKPREPVSYCREPGPLGPHGVYRPGGSTRSYLIALGDAGIALSLAPADLDVLLDSRRKRVAMTLLGRDSISVLPSFNRLPPPEQALEVAQVSPPRLTTTVGPERKD